MFIRLSVLIAFGLVVGSLPVSSAISMPRVLNGSAAAHLVASLAPFSPDLDADGRTAISQDINGAPLTLRPVVHTLGARIIYCRKQVINGGLPATCKIDFGKRRTRQATGKDGEALYNALEAFGSGDDAEKGYVVRAVRKLRCTVNDRIAQNTPATGDDIAGIRCQFDKYD